MFRTGSPYSPFFTSGLLSSPVSPASPIDFNELRPRRGSLPTSSSDRSSAYYFSLQSRRNINEFRSFLTLDLAETRSKRGSNNHWSEVVVQHPPLPDSPTFTSRSASPRLRSMPSPKPAPSITLPELPVVPTHSPVASSSFTLPDSFTKPLRITRPKLPSPASSRSRKSLAVKTPLLSPRIARSISTSTVSTRYRTLRRTSALAALEGHRKRTQSLLMSQNFISLSDDEGDDELSDDDDDESSDSDESSIDMLPSVSERSQGSQRSRSDWLHLKSFIDLRNEREDSTREKDRASFNSGSSWGWRSYIEIAMA
ncbi:uncharacterized protein BT62DRAFT_934062 [Guyanagaster necrorhizus]|uniref:Uncharacterized protein n=1 Tax=Guyanagaster necrorhizus TaxID=856835 RepID=A0A9P7VPN3_9AGAR|nr:uncharacterized protein BT62DRAFT_934062 [Guyanagaster necrorhizus MCA 3950]KAG7444398.1 hypothetical protein BT62DRAFT_934062 [Guyanagaster necrorhizus MCA 3950]